MGETKEETKRKLKSAIEALRIMMAIVVLSIGKTGREGRGPCWAQVMSQIPTLAEWSRFEGMMVDAGLVTIEGEELVLTDEGRAFGDRMRAEIQGETDTGALA